MDSQDHAVAEDHVFQLNVLAEFAITHQYVKLDPLTATFCRVTLPEAQLLVVHCASNTL